MKPLPAASLLSFAAGVVFWGGLHTAVEATNSEDFCISCHEMRDNVYPEYKETIHYKNPAGVRATCPDCHVPRHWGPKMRRKITASGELLRTLEGTIATKEKFQARRLELAQRVWAEMKATDSRECRNCHAQEFMDLERQNPMAQRMHSMDALRESGQTCIDCHKGVAHSLPEGAED